ncbi:hypothetical protein GS490_13355 [Rhodococcus hoagii]|nr:hypothetical protein [Prescottella equi]
MPEMTPTHEPAGRIELSDEWAVEAQPPVQVSLFGKPYDIRCDFTGKEVLEFSHLLRKTPEVGEDGKTAPDAVTKLWEERFLFILADGDPTQLAADIGEQNIGVANKMINRIYGLAGLLDAEGNFRAL